MTRGTDIARPRSPTRVLNQGNIGSSSHTADMIASATLLALLIAAFAKGADAPGQIDHTEIIHQSHAAFVIEVVATLGVSVGLAWLLFLCCPRDDDEGATS